MSACVKRHLLAADTIDGSVQQRQRKHEDERRCLALASLVSQSSLLFAAAATAEQRALLYRHVELRSFRNEVDYKAAISLSVNLYWRAAVSDAASRCNLPSARTLKCMCTFVDALYQPDFEAEFERRLQRLRDDYADALFEMLGWQHPPKESFNRFLLENHVALHMVADTDSNATHARDHLDSPLPFSVAAATAVQQRPSSMASEIFEDLPAKIHPAWSFVATAAQAGERIGKYVRAAARLLTRHRDAYLRGSMQSALDELGAIATRLSELPAATVSAAMSKSDDVNADEFSASVDEAVRLETQCTANFISAFRAPIDALCERMTQEVHRQAEELLKISPLCRYKEMAVSGGASELSFCAELDSSTGHVRIRAINLHGAEEYETVAVSHFLKLAQQYQMHHLLADAPTRTAATDSPPTSVATLLPASTVGNFEAASSDPLFLRAAFVLLRRYRTICGAERGAASGCGFHAAIPRAVLDAMNAHFGVALECFASPLNAYFPHYCSANPALEAAFGSIGSFFATSFVAGSFVANPPFAWAMMDVMFARIDKMLVASEQSTSADGEPNRPLTFFIVVPHWNNPPLESALAARRSSFYRGGFVLPAQQHCYVSGLQHCDGSNADAAATSNCGSIDAGLALIPKEDAPSCDTTRVCATLPSDSSVPIPSTANVNVTPRRSQTFPCVHATEVLVLQNAAAAAQCTSSPAEAPNEDIATHHTSITSSACNPAAAGSSSYRAALFENAAAGAMSIAQRIEAVRRAWLSIPHEW